MENIREDLTVQIGHIQQILEEVYVGIGAEYSTLRQAMDEQLAVSIKIVSDFKRKISTSEDSLLGTVQSVESFIAESIKSYEGMDRESEELVNVFKNSFKGIESIMKNIRTIRDASEVMEVLALNAMVVAIQSGKNGGGFTFISDALKTTASNTIRLSDEVLTIGSSIHETYDEINNMLESIVFLNEDLHTFFSKTIQFQFQQFYNLTGTYVDFLEQLYLEAEKVKEPVFAIMQDLQYQDIIRQSLDHITLFIRELPRYSGDSDTKLLDELAIVDVIIDFASDILIEVRSRVVSNLTAFRERIDRVQKTGEEVGRMRNRFKEEHTGQVRVSENMHDVIQEFRNGMVSLLQDLKEGDRIKASLKQNEARLFTMVHNLNQKASGFETLTQSFRNIIVLGRIEISKMKALQNVYSAMQDINENTDRIDSSIEEIKEKYSDMNEFDKRIRDLFEKLFSSDTTREDELMGQFRMLENLLNETFDGLMEVVDGFGFFSGKFHSMAEDTAFRVEGLRRVIDSVDLLLDECQNTSNENADLRKKLLGQLGLERWEMKYRGVEDIVKKFTVYRHRKNARELTGAVESAHTMEEGSVSFFSD